jgi:hypothetical protein
VVTLVELGGLPPRATDTITAASGGHRPVLFRSPGGIWSPTVLTGTPKPDHGPWTGPSTPATGHAPAYHTSSMSS